MKRNIFCIFMLREDQKMCNLSFLISDYGSSSLSLDMGTFLSAAWTCLKLRFQTQVSRSHCVTTSSCAQSTIIVYVTEWHRLGSMTTQLSNT